MLEEHPDPSFRCFDCGPDRRQLEIGPGRQALQVGLGREALQVGLGRVTLQVGLRGQRRQNLLDATDAIVKVSENSFHL